MKTDAEILKIRDVSVRKFDSQIVPMIEADLQANGFSAYMNKFVDMAREAHSYGVEAGIEAMQAAIEWVDSEVARLRELAERRRVEMNEIVDNASKERYRLREERQAMSNSIGDALTILENLDLDLGTRVSQAFDRLSKGKP